MFENVHGITQLTAFDLISPLPIINPAISFVVNITSTVSPWLCNAPYPTPSKKRRTEIQQRRMKSPTKCSLLITNYQSIIPLSNKKLIQRLSRNNKLPRTKQEKRSHTFPVKNQKKEETGNKVIFQSRHLVSRVALHESVTGGKWEATLGWKRGYIRYESRITT